MVKEANGVVAPIVFVRVSRPAVPAEALVVVIVRSKPPLIVPFRVSGPLFLMDDVEPKVIAPA
jgi:hypothetical protein